MMAVMGDTTAGFIITVTVMITATIVTIIQPIGIIITIIIIIIVNRPGLIIDQTGLPDQMKSRTGPTGRAMGQIGPTINGRIGLAGPIIDRTVPEVMVPDRDRRGHPVLKAVGQLPVRYVLRAPTEARPPRVRFGRPAPTEARPPRVRFGRPASTEARPPRVRFGQPAPAGAKQLMPAKSGHPGLKVLSAKPRRGPLANQAATLKIAGRIVVDYKLEEKRAGSQICAGKSG